MSDLSSIGGFDPGSLFSTNPTGLSFPSAGASALSGASALAGASAFNSLVDQMMSNATARTPQNAQLVLAQAKMADSQVLSGMFADPAASLLGSGLTGLGGENLFALPAWTYQAASLSGDPKMEALLNLYTQEASLVQSQLLGGGSSFNGLF